MSTIPGLVSPLTPAAYGDRYGLDASVVVVYLRNGTLAGARYNGRWYAEDVPPPDPPAALPAEAGRVLVEAQPDRPLVVRYTSQTYVNVLMGILVALIAADMVSFVLSWDGHALRGIGTRAFVLWALHARHRWARRAVYLWAGTLALAGAVGLAVLGAADVTSLYASLPTVLLLGAMLVCGLFYLATVHRVICIEPEPDVSTVTLDDIRREARLD